ncbi:MAG TPA: rRNA maturation RNase YbeY [Candidatus Paceibacterota bacterium]|nr:rRNA maturation RNase YbeY [Candidatus Paceibacterota bacterium]
MKDLDLVFKNATRDTLPWRGLIVCAFHAARPWLKIPKRHTAELGVQIIGPARMRSMNRHWRKVDTPTDVLSFPLHQRPIRGYTAVSLGDLFICPAIVRAKAKADGRPVKDQMKWTIVHGLLHLAGYDHEKSAAAARRMASVERTILKKIG